MYIVSVSRVLCDRNEGSVRISNSRRRMWYDSSKSAKTHSYVWNDSSICVKTQSYVWHHSSICVKTHSYVWHDTSFVWHDWFMCVTWLISMCVTWRIHRWDMPDSYAWHDSFICADTAYSYVQTWLIHMCNMMSHIWMRHIFHITYSDVCDMIIYTYDLSHSEV